jgi:hypothetical protein
MEGIISIDMARGTYLDRSQMERFFLESWDVLESIVKKYSRIFKPKKTDGGVFYKVNKDTEEIVDWELDQIYKVPDYYNGRNVMRALSGLKKIVEQTRQQIKEKKEISSRMINAIDVTISHSQIHNKDALSISDCVYASYIRDSAFASMNGHPITPHEYLENIQKAMIMFPEENLFLRDKPANIEYFVQNLYSAVVSDCERHRIGTGSRN